MRPNTHNSLPASPPPKEEIYHLARLSDPITMEYIREAMTRRSFVPLILAAPTLPQSQAAANRVVIDPLTRAGHH